MKISAKQTSLLFKLATVVAAFVFFSSRSPLTDNSSLHFSNVLIGVVLLGSSAMFIMQLVLETFLPINISKYFAVALSAALIEVLLIASLGSVTIFQILILIVFNILLAWYFVKRFRTK